MMYGVLFLMSFILATAGDQSVVTAIHQMEILYRSEKSFATQISDFADQLQQLVDSMRIYADSFEAVRPRKSGSEAMHNPIDAHLLIRHLATGWPVLKKSMDKFHDLMAVAEYLRTREEREKLPVEKDMEFTELALIRLIATYKLNATQFVRGVLQAGSFLSEYKSNNKLTVWDLGRIAIGLLNYQLYAPAIDLLDEAIKVLLENKGVDAKGTKLERIAFSKSPSVIVPRNVNEEMRSTDLLQLKYKAIKQHNEMLDKVVKREVETFGDGLRTSAYTTHKKYSITAVQDAFRRSFNLQLNTIPSPFMEREQTFLLCRGQELRNIVALSKLRCHLSRSSTFPPSKLEDISLEPRIVLAHEIMSETRMRQIIGRASLKLEGSTPDSSMSFKSALLDIEDVDGTFIRRLESITKTVAERRQRALLVVRNFGVAGSFGIHSDFRQENFTHAGTAQVFLSRVDEGGFIVFPRIGVHVRPQQGSALIYWNVDSSGHEDPLLVHSDCPVVRGNKWVALHWFNAPTETKCQTKKTT